MSNNHMGWEGGHFNHTSGQFKDIFESDTSQISMRAYNGKPYGCAPVTKDTEVTRTRECCDTGGIEITCFKGTLAPKVKVCF